ncbi:MAG: NADH ubiquinone oxidoreductase 20 kDa subunit [candidate division WWE3 bacterium GW2011_GWF2_41_45]|uniref:NADH:ubiquinone oxidoreductase-like 20kDa subunit domain-containing protein n=3 Tax=Katanobacteria TaxID=422282 RepID=A0A1F4W2P0_UNCKA|nr:MAG: NADH ubiquinone oxidoreductase 20 kDa subunit [candidate division WWE3 bacterium GW2011_GWC2_41_23]KKS08926.1 MAG: NADH ubiquinone oxidoreductase 20 kDa subunit [candidate division WWE3 bacterium GW2011_GWF2_41_45]KKS11830.1 MAG: NADH ubiquinone oxidoreductase 20 kDa subunit [candidate division WWE3 bacterium GW2011_GWF1_41_53]KKS19510.1 MAG: NADH ubiquinone oxidoreductase 20 kDa subunit [candidate division WWE3 bacterium GW2011_GWE1_41_72]KKS25929.1 MAG: NADH ubiquinone oxidoreductase 
MDAANTTAQSPEKKKLVVGWFSFTCSEDSTILFTELLNDHFNEWKTLVEFRHLKALKTNNSINDLDVAFIEGAISSEKQAAEVTKIRNNSKYVVAIGACACNGLPSASRNMFVPENVSFKTKWYLENFDYAAKVKKLEDVIKVDDKVEGCPMNAEAFKTALWKYLKLFRIVENA